jgi:hypothetical protein
MAPTPPPITKKKEKKKRGNNNNNNRHTKGKQMYYKWLKYSYLPCKKLCNTQQKKALQIPDWKQKFTLQNNKNKKLKLKLTITIKKL